ncbi:MAG: response regulator transcription factor [Gammaproteobacteria bacterium]|nr:response regulator transcription factor [Gammaproteobacteria bacterium]
MNNRERWVMAGVLAVVVAMIGADLLNDSSEGVSVWHVLVESMAGLVAALGLIYLLHGTYLLQHRLTEEVAKSTALQKQSEIWRVDARRYVDGLARAINEQLTRWNLTVAEKEVTFLLLKGLGFKEIAMVRNTSERTARAQSTAIYAKAGLSGRTELAAFFLEDLLLPQET